MDTQIPQSPNSDSSSTVDVSRPFRSVKEAVAIFGERLLFGDIQASPKRVSFTVEKAASNLSELPQSPNTSVDIVAKEVEVSFVKELSHSRELTEIPNTPQKTTGKEVIESDQLIQSPVRHPNVGVERDADSPADESSHLLNRIQSPKDSPSTEIKHIVDSPMFELTPSPQFPKNENHGNIVHGNDLVMMLMILKRLESELQETNRELKLLKERESETEVALASLNAELHKSMSKMAKAEAAEAAKAAAISIPSIEEQNRAPQMKTEETIRGDIIVKTMDSPTLAQILSMTDYDGYFGGNKKTNKVMKKKPIVPLVTDLIPWRKKSSPTNDLSGPLSTSRTYFS